MPLSVAERSRQRLTCPWERSRLQVRKELHRAEEALARFKRRFASEHGRKPTLEELSAEPVYVECRRLQRVAAVTTMDVERDERSSTGDLDHSVEVAADRR